MKQWSIVKQWTPTLKVLELSSFQRMGQLRVGFWPWHLFLEITSFWHWPRELKVLILLAFVAFDRLFPKFPLTTLSILALAHPPPFFWTPPWTRVLLRGDRSKWTFFYFQIVPSCHWLYPPQYLLQCLEVDFKSVTMPLALPSPGGCRYLILVTRRS